MIESVSLPLESGLVHMTYFGQRNVKKCDASRGLKTAYALGLSFLAARSLFATTDKIQISILEDENTW